MIRVRFLRTFDVSLDALTPRERAKAASAVKCLLDYFGGGPKPLGLGLRKLRVNYWEILVGLDQRIFFSLESDLATFIVAGNHAEIRRRLGRY